MNVLIIGGVAAGTKVAAKLKRENRDTRVTILTKDAEISYAGCGLPYYVGDAIEKREKLIVNTPEKFASLTGAEVRTLTEALAVSPEKKTVTVCSNGVQEELPYDKLVIATGASAVVPPLPGTQLKNVFTLRTPDDADAVKACAHSGVKTAVVVGGGFIGLEIAENLSALGVNVYIVEFMPQLLANVFDPEMAAFIRRHLLAQKIHVMVGTKVEEITGDGHVQSVRTSEGTIFADMVVLSTGIRPNTAFLEGSGIAMDKGRIVVDETLATNVDDIYAAGDCVLVKNRLTGKPQWSPMGSSANLEGRTLAQILNGKTKRYPGVLGTGVVKMPHLCAGRTGLTEAQAKEAGYDVISAVTISDDKAHYYPDAAFFATKLIADKTTGALLGAQVLGPGAVDKMIDIAVTGMNMGACLADFDQADYAYAPPFSTAIHPFVQAVYVLENKIDGTLVSMTPYEYMTGKAAGYRVIDSSPKPSIPGALHVDFTKLGDEIPGVGKDEKLLLVCVRGKRAYLLQNRLRHLGYTHTAVLEGSTFFNEVRAQPLTCTVSPEDVKRVKGLGFLHDKNTTDCFNARVITRNGKITAEESSVIAEAARRFGNGEMAMTTRLTVEIQHIPYANIEPLREFLAMAGLETGGTGPKVRPVVSCKGTTCQYGLIDTYALSEEIHERFYKAMHDVKLPHKFKIAVGGCPNNCVKPDLNDLGIIGQRHPVLQLDKCRGCKVCQIEKNCPVKAASVVDGKIHIHPDLCNNCGRCLTKCPFKVFETSVPGYKVTIGGRWGKKVGQGTALRKLFTDKEEVLTAVERSILFFRDYGNPGERFHDTIERIGFDTVEAAILTGSFPEGSFPEKEAPAPEQK